MGDEENWPAEISSLSQHALEILLTSDADLKASRTQRLVHLWNSRTITTVGEVTAPSKPNRPQNLTTVLPKNAPKRGKGGTKNSRLALLHSLVHIENWAIDLTWDIIIRFVHENLPVEYYDDWVRIASEEAKIERRRVILWSI
eukprot:TRINITY_DN1561_c0_g1_i2.p2 TRINITY_DN1561_c0_g1~~TRINITY_DN1561_c0_g1_i2.p2  ORF type:complete len:143 (-),score=15.65 TRINITY_DN1561_c0_g1_i2:471-899(-)